MSIWVSNHTPPTCLLAHFAGLAGFSHKLDKDPWTDKTPLNRHKRPIGVLCAHLEGGTVTYMSPEQLWVINESKKIDKAADKPIYLAHKDRWQVTPATSDNFQVSLTILEMFARAGRWFGPGAVSRLAAVRECASRTPVSVVRAMTPADAERWVVEKLGVGKLAGKIESAGIDGTKMIELSKMSLSDAKKAHKGMSAPVHTKLKGVAHGVSTPADAMPEEIAALLEKTLAENVGERPMTVKEMLAPLLQSEAARLKEAKKAEWYGKVMDGKKGPIKATEHPDETVAATLGGLAKTLVIHGDVAGALAACAEWWGVAFSPEARQAAAEAYRNCWKRHGASLRSLDLSRTARGQWREEMMGGEETVLRLAQDIAHSGASAIEMIDLSQQPQLEGPVLENFFSVSEFSCPTLVTLKIKNCRNASGSIPASICECVKLQTLDLQGCGFSGVFSTQSERLRI